MFERSGNNNILQGGVPCENVWKATVLSFKVKSSPWKCLKEVATILSFKVKNSLSESQKEVTTILSFKVKSSLSASEKEVATILSFKVKSSLWECLKGKSIVLQGWVPSECLQEVATILSFKVKSSLSESEKEVATISRSGNNIILHGYEFPVRMFERQQYCPSRWRVPSECLNEVATILAFKVKSSLWECLKEVATIPASKVKKSLP